MAVVGVRHARADCTDSDVGCMLQEEARALFAAGRFDDAAAKFKASIAAQPSARAYLGYAQAVEALGKPAFGYEMILEAQRLSDQEVRSTPDDVDVQGRAERIKYKVAELRAKIAVTRLLLPPSVSPDQLLSVHRKDEGDLIDPLNHTIAVAASSQAMTATLRDGRVIEFTATIAAGDEGPTLIPVPAPVAAANPVSQPTVIQVRHDEGDSRWIPKGLVGLGAIGLGIGVWAVIDTYSKRQDAYDAGCNADFSKCVGNKAVGIAQDAYDRGNLATGLLVGGTLLLGVGVVWLLSTSGDGDESTSSTKTAWRFAPTIGHGHAGLSLDHRF